jgi:probable rRNA maturation factor
MNEEIALVAFGEILKIAQSEDELRARGPQAPWTAGLTLVTKSEMTRLNGTFREKPTHTDILSFPAVVPPNMKEIAEFGYQGYLGDIAICTPVLKAQAKAFGHTEEEELLVLIVHGLLHLLGFDHELGEKEERLMRSWEEKLLKICSVTRSGLIHRAQWNTSVSFNIQDVTPKPKAKAATRKPVKKKPVMKKSVAKKKKKASPARKKLVVAAKKKKAAAPSSRRKVSKRS